MSAAEADPSLVEQSARRTAPWPLAPRLFSHRHVIRNQCVGRESAALPCTHARYLAFPDAKSRSTGRTPSVSSHEGCDAGDEREGHTPAELPLRAASCSRSRKDKREKCGASCCSSGGQPGPGTSGGPSPQLRWSEAGAPYRRSYPSPCHHVQWPLLSKDLFKGRECV